MVQVTAVAEHIHFKLCTLLLHSGSVAQAVAQVRQHMLSLHSLSLSLSLTLCHSLSLRSGSTCSRYTLSLSLTHSLSLSVSQVRQHMLSLHSLSLCLSLSFSHSLSLSVSQVRQHMLRWKRCLPPRAPPVVHAAHAAWCSRQVSQKVISIGCQSVRQWSSFLSLRTGVRA
jgi:hypothetical protein